MPPSSCRINCPNVVFVIYEEGAVVLHSSVPTGDPEAMIASIEAYRQRGYRIHSCKVGGTVEPDIARIRGVTEGLPDGEAATFDANRSWLPDQAIQVMNAVRDVGGYYEQPCETYEECLAVQRRTDHPFVLDEVIDGIDPRYIDVYEKAALDDALHNLSGKSLDNAKDWAAWYRNERKSQ